MTFHHGIKTTLLADSIRPLAIVATSIIGLIGTAPDADADAFPLDTAVKLTGPRAAALLDTTENGDNNGTLKDAIDGIFDQFGATIYVVRVAEGADEAATLANIVGDRATAKGVHAFTAISGLQPKIIVAPGFTHQRPGDTANPVVAELKGIAASLRAVVIADGPNTDDASALQAAVDAESERVFVVDPHVLVSVGGVPVAQPASARVAGIIARTDHELGFWYSPSSKVMNGIVGIDRPVSFNISDSNSQANLLNAGKVATIIQNDGFRLWGNLGTGSDSTTQFLANLRFYDYVMDQLEKITIWAQDLPQHPSLLKDVQSSVDGALRQLEREGATLIVSVSLDPELNSVEAFIGGDAYWNIGLAPGAPLQSMNFSVSRVAEAYEILLLDAA